VLPEPVPVELNHHATEEVGPDLLVRGPDDHGGLRALDAGLGHRPPRAKRHLRVEELVGGAKRLVAAGQRAGLVLIDAQPVAGADDEVLLAEVLGLPEGCQGHLAALEVWPQGHEVTEPEPQGVAVHLDEGVLHALGLRAQARLVASLLGIVEPARIVVVLEARPGRRLVRDRVAPLRLLRPIQGRIVAREHGVLAGIERPAQPHAKEVLGGPGGTALLERERDGRIARRHVVGREPIGEHQRVLARLVPEEVVDALVLEQALHEAQIALAILHAVLALAIDTPLERARLEIGQPPLREHRGHDLDRVLTDLIEDPAVAGVLELPQERFQHGPVAGEPVRDARLGESRNRAVKAALAPARERKADPHRLAQHLVGVEVRIGRKQTELEPIRRAEGLGADQRLQQQDPLVERPADPRVATE